MKISLQPQTDFTIVRQLGDHTDSSTYYVQAVIRKSVDDSILKTVNLTDKGNGRFKTDYRVPADVSGQGFYLDITTSVYSDSGYTTKADTYSDENETYLVYDRTKGSGGGGGGGGADVDYKKIQKMIDGLVEKFPKTKLKGVSTLLEDIKAGIVRLGDKMDMEEPEEKEEIDFAPVLSAIETSKKEVVKAIEDKDVTPETILDDVIEAINNKETDLSGIDQKLDTLSQALEAHVEDFNDKYEEGAIAKEKLSQMAGIFGGQTPIELPKKKEMVPEVNPLQERVKRLL